MVRIANLVSRIQTRLSEVLVASSIKNFSYYSSNIRLEAFQNHSRKIELNIYFMLITIFKNFIMILAFN